MQTHVQHRARGLVCSISSHICLSLLLSACSTPATPAASSTPANTATAAATPTPAPTVTPAPTPLPGIEVYPVSTLGDSIPWLPQDRSRNPFTAFYGFNFQKPPFNSLLVRKAFAAAVDKEQIAGEARGFKMREAVPAMTLTPASVLARDLYGNVGVAFDPVQARSFLKEAGYPDPAHFPHTTLMVYMRSSAAPGVHFRIAESVVRMWESHLGVSVEIKTVEDPATMFARWEREMPEMFALGWGADYVDPDNFLRALFHSGSEFNLGHFGSPAFDSLVEQAAGLRDAGERQLLYLRAEQILAEEQVALVPLFHSLGYLP